MTTFQIGDCQLESTWLKSHRPKYIALYSTTIERLA